MLQKVLFVLFFVLLFTMGHGQTKLDATNNTIDTSAILKELAGLLDSTDESKSSYFYLSAGVGNRLFSEHNNSINSKQATNNKIIYTPAISYYHKSGFNITAGTFLLNDGQKFGANQYMISAGYTLPENEKYSFEFAYAHYFVSDIYSTYSSPVQNDLYAAFSYKQYWLEPGIAMGYSTGAYGDVKYKDSILGNGLRRRLYDSTTNNIHAFSTALTLGHSFKWKQLSHHKDALLILPTLLLNAGSDKTNITHKTNAANLLNALNKRGKLPKIASSKFGIQSVGLDLMANYTIGNFSIESECYVDYSNSNSPAFTQQFSLTVGYSF